MNLKKIKNTYKTFKNDSNRKSNIIIIYEFIDLWIRHKEFPTHYISRFLYRKEYINYRDFIPTKKYYKLIQSEKIQNSFFGSILNNKLFFSFFCTDNDIRIPILTSYNYKRCFYLANQKYNIDSTSDLKIFFNKVFKVHKCNAIFIKSISNYGGTGIFLLQKEYLDQQINVFGNKILAGSFIHQESVIQHRMINKIYAQSLNTIRFDVCNIDNQITVLGAVMRFGSMGSVIDNRSKGGFFISIDDENGQLLKKGQKQMGYGGAELYKHPDTDFVFEGFKIPHYSQARNLAIEMSNLLPNKIVGWDIAITDQGPLVIEGNHNSNITMTELQYGGYLKHPIIKKLLKTI